MKTPYRIFIYHENNKIIKLEIYDSLLEFMINDDHSTIDILINSFPISESIYKKIQLIQKENFLFFKNYSTHEFIKKFGLEEVMV